MPGIAAFVGTAPGQFEADFAVSERPLTAAESAKAKADGRSYAYVPFAATPVAIATLVPTEQWGASGEQSITPSQFCQHMPLSTTLLGDIFGADAQKPLNNWGDSRIVCPSSTGSGTAADGLPITPWANLDPSMANYALMALLDSTPTSKALFEAGLTSGGRPSLTHDTTPSENWPYGLNTIPGGDQPLLGKILDINPETNAPDPDAESWALGAVLPISSVWTGAPLGVPWDLATAAVQNAQGSYVAPSVAAAKASQDDASMATTSDPATNNLVTFKASSTDAGAYNNYLMEESYLIVPTNGLAADKATALAQLVRFALGTQGQADIELYGAAPATPAMQTVGLKVAAELDVEAVVQPNPTPTTSVTTTSSTPPAPVTASDTGTGTTGSDGTDSTGTAGSTSPDSSSPSLAFTGAAGVGQLIGVGAVLLAMGAILRRRFRRKGAQP